jgi:methionine biosynthesis protein MetW
MFGYPKTEVASCPSVDYSAYWVKRGRKKLQELSSWQKQRADIIAARIEPGASVVDLGCGDGGILSYLKKEKQIDGIGIDIESVALEAAENAGLRVLNMDLTNREQWERIPQADYVLCLEIMEHLPNPEELMAVLKVRTKKAIFVSFPNTGYYRHRLRLLFGSFPLQWITHPGEHLRFWTVRDAKWWVKELGVELEECIAYEGLPLINKIWPSMFAEGLVLKIKI